MALRYVFLLFLQHIFISSIIEAPARLSSIYFTNVAGDSNGTNKKYIIKMIVKKVILVPHSTRVEWAI